jgi:hypothetical protein
MSYGGCQGSGTLNQIKADRTLEGAFGLSCLWTTRIAEIRDGTSNTLMYGEVIQTRDGPDWRTFWVDDAINRFTTVYTPNT